MHSYNQSLYRFLTPFSTCLHFLKQESYEQLLSAPMPSHIGMLSQYAQQFFCVSIMENYRTININRGRGVPHFIQILFLVPCAQRYSFGLENKLPPMLHLQANLLNFRLQRHLNYNKLHKMTKFLGKCSIN